MRLAQARREIEGRRADVPVTTAERQELSSFAEGGTASDAEAKRCIPSGVRRQMVVLAVRPDLEGRRPRKFEFVKRNKRSDNWVAQGTEMKAGVLRV